MAKRVIIQGYRGAFHEIAARNFFGDQELDIIAADSFPELVERLESDSDGLIGMMAIENTLYGSLLQNYKLLRRANLTIVGEVYLRVAQQLLGLPGTKLSDLTEVSSHPVAIAQCKDFFKNYENIDLVESVDTALSAKDVSEGGESSKAAIASKLAGKLYGLEVISDNIETNKKNFTRFLVLEKKNEQQVSTKANKVSLVFRAGHEVGSLHKVLGILSAYNLNMTKIHSAPIVGETWKYKFFIDFELEGLVGYQHAIEAIRPLVEELKILGVYEKESIMKISVASRLGSVEEYYFSKKLREIREMNDKGLDVLNLGIGSPDMAPHPDVITALQNTASLDNMHGYQSYMGIPQLRMAMGRWYSKYYKVSFDSTKEILPLIGSKEGIMHISMTYLEEGDEVLVPNPGYPAYASAAKLTGATIRHYDLKAENAWEPDFDALESTDLSKVKIMWVNYPNMPTGKPASRDLFERLIALGKRHNILIINDNPYSFIMNEYPESMMSVDGAIDTAMELNSLSKAHNMAGWRVGMLVGHGDRISEVLRFKSNMDSGMFRGTQEAAIKALELGPEWFEELNGHYAKRKEVACRLLDLLECEYDDDHQGLFVWAKVPNRYKDAYELADQCLYESKVFLTPGGIFGSNGDQYVRISLCAKVPQLEKAIGRIKESLLTSKSIS